MHEVEANPRFSLQGVAAPDSAAAFAQDVRRGLTASPKRLSCQFFYDGEGSRLFEQICRLPEYYPTRTEAAILKDLAPELVTMMGTSVELVELGSGSAEKTRLLIQAFLGARGSLTYRPIDISVDAIQDSSHSLLKEYAALSIDALAMDYHAGLAALRAREESSAARLVLWLGSSVGNFTRSAAAEFLGQMRAQMGPRDRLLMGVDLRKGKAELEAAYDDAQGVTAAFNKNLLTRINASFGSDFDLDAFEHEARYLVDEGRVEMWLCSKRAQAVSIPGLDMRVEFDAGEGIHTENSHKYSGPEIEALTRTAGFSIEKQWSDTEQRFCDVLLAPVNP